MQPMNRNKTSELQKKVSDQPMPPKSKDMDSESEIYWIGKDLLENITEWELSTLKDQIKKLKESLMN